MTNDKENEIGKDMGGGKGRMMAMVALLTVAGLLGNYFRLQLIFNIELLFGSIFTMIVIRLYGLRAGVFSAVVSSSYTYYLWHQPYGALILIAEAFFVGRCFEKRKSDIVLADTVYWVVVGMPLFALTYHIVMGLPWHNTVLTMLKYALTGITSAAVASLAMLGVNHFRSKTGRSSEHIPLNQIIFNIMVALVILPSAFYLAYSTRSTMRDEEQGIRQKLSKISAITKMEIACRLSDSIERVNILSSMVGDPGKTPKSLQQKYVETVHKNQRDFLRMGVFDKNVVTTAFSPLVDENGKSNIGMDSSKNPFFAEMLKTNKLVVTDVFMGKVTRTPIIIIAVPIMEKGCFLGFAKGTMSMQELSSYLANVTKDWDVSVTILDRKGNVIISTDPNRPSLSKIVESKFNKSLDLGGGVFKTGPFADTKMPITKRYMDAVYHIESPIDGESGWSVMVEMPLAGLYKRMVASTTVDLTILMAFILISVALSYFASRLITDSLARLSAITDKLPEEIENRKNPSWPISSISEVSSLISNFKAMSNAMSVYIAQLSAVNETLEDRVRSRTEELQKSNEALEREMKSRIMAEDFSQTALDTVDESFVIVDRGYRILQANKAFCKFAGSPCEEIIGKTCHEITHHKDHPCHLDKEDCVVNKVFETGKPQASAHNHLDSDGNTIFIEAKGFPIMDESGDVVSVIKILNDVTDKKRLEVQLRQSQKMEAIGLLAGGVAHDFNNILTGIIGFCNLIEMKMSDRDPLKVHIEQILAMTDKGSSLTQGLLAFGRKQVINPKKIDLNLSVKKMEKLLHRLIGEDVALTTSLFDRNMTVMADEGQIEQVLMNLVTNARDSMDDGGSVTIETRLFEMDDNFVRARRFGIPGQYAMMSISDNGCGMDERTIERIFEPFFTSKAISKGSGLGLAIVYGIVKQNNGYIVVESELGKGTTFRIYLPLVEGPTAPAKVERKAPMPQGGSELVLIAEDDILLRNLAENILSEFGYRVITAADGEDAINKFRQKQDSIDLLILDVIMPRKNGKEVYDEAKKLKPKIKALFFSGYTADIVHKKGIFDENLNFMAKPFHQADLLKKIRQILDTDV